MNQPLTIELIRAFSDEINLGNDLQSRNRMGQIAEGFRARHTNKFLDQMYDAIHETEGACIAMVCGSTNSFKHRVRSKEAESDSVIGRRFRLLAEYAVTLRAYAGMGKMFKAMLGEMNEKKKLQESAAETSDSPFDILTDIKKRTSWRPEECWHPS